MKKTAGHFTGVSLEAMVLTLEGLGVDAMGINCSLGPVEIFPMAEKLQEPDGCACSGDQTECRPAGSGDR